MIDLQPVAADDLSSVPVGSAARTNGRSHSLANHLTRQIKLMRKRWESGAPIASESNEVNADLRGKALFLVGFDGVQPMELSPNYRRKK